MLTKVRLVKAMVFPSNHVWMWELDYKESWALKSWYFWTVVLEKTLERPLDCKGIQPVHPKGNHSWIVIGTLILKLKLQYFGRLMWRTDSLEKTLMLEKRQGKGTKEDEIVGWHYQLDGHKVEQAPGVGDGQRTLACCSPWGQKELDRTEQLNWTDSQHYSTLGEVKSLLWTHPLWVFSHSSQGT